MRYEKFDAQLTFSKDGKEVCAELLEELFDRASEPLHSLAWNCNDSVDIWHGYIDVYGASSGWVEDLQDAVEQIVADAHKEGYAVGGEVRTHAYDLDEVVRIVPTESGVSLYSLKYSWEPMD